MGIKLGVAPVDPDSMTIERRPCIILIIEDNEADAVLVGECLAADGNETIAVEHCGDLATGMARLGEGGVDLVLLDLGLPDSHGLDTLERLRAAQPTVSVVVLTGLADEDMGLRAVQLGAQDYLVKGSFGGYVLVRAARYAMERARLVEQLEELARSDQLTGLRTGHVFIESLDHAVRQARRGHRSMLLYADLDGFKACNDSRGHAFGDDVLVAFAKILSDETRGNDMCARLGGDEYAVLLDGVGREAAEAVDRRIRARLESISRSLDICISFSGGMAPVDGSLSAEALLKTADAAMYAAKQAGGGRSVTAKPTAGEDATA
jgi:diguanylate cyclase (GGDEF)-like protein